VHASALEVEATAFVRPVPGPGDVVLFAACTAARIHALPRAPPGAANELPALAEKGCIGAGLGILVPVRRPKATGYSARDDSLVREGKRDRHQ